MRIKETALLLLFCAVLAPVWAGRPVGEARSVRLENITWLEAEKALTPDTVVMIPMGAACKEHGPHLKLANDWTMAQYLSERVQARTAVVVAPAVGYSFYPAFVEYPGTVSLRQETARDLIVDICHSLARFGPKRFYVLNTGVSTVGPLASAVTALAKERIHLEYTDLLKVLEPAAKKVQQQAGGTHADEIETSMMLYIAPTTVDMSKAVKDYDPRDRKGLTRDPKGTATYSPTGIWGDPTLATRAKGRAVVEALIDGIVADIERLRRTPLH
jgi:creatinine amidohydrolase